MSLLGEPTARVDAAAHAVATPLDAMRSALLRRFGRQLAPWIADRAGRTSLVASLALLTNLALVATVPVLLLRVGPLILGVPHLLADVRYLVARPALHRRIPVVVLVLVPCGLALVHPAAEVAGFATLGAALAARGSSARRAAVASAGVVLLLAARLGGDLADVIFAHAHHAVAGVVALALFARGARERRAMLAPLALATAATVVLALGFVAPPTPHAGTILAAFGAGLAPVPDPSALDATVLARIALVFVFGQTAHYVAWLRVVPELARPRRSPRSFARSYAALVEDLGRPLLVFAFGLAAAFACAAMADVEMARSAYLRLALFHGPLELGVLAIAFVERGAPWTR